MSEGRDIIEPPQWHQRDDRRGAGAEPELQPARIVRYVRLASLHTVWP